MRKDNLIYKQFGEHAILVEWQSVITTGLIDEITIFKNKTLYHKKTQIQDFIIGYNSLVIKYHRNFNFSTEVSELQKIHSEETILQKEQKYTWEIPVCYDEFYGFDSVQLSKKLNISIQELIQLHERIVYTVHFIGFLPGFLYLGGLDKKLYAQRKATPLLKVPKGSVAIGGEQTGIYPEESAGGWHIIGRTPINFFDITQSVPCFAKPGDKIQFKSITKETYIFIEKEIEEKKYELLKKEFNA